ncbi:MAG: patatin-like phospholipase family protein [Hyphomonadaceae bacterium]|nr:patatin-like phospholipase family protein [Hyphomonadaceae bacterium]
MAKRPSAKAARDYPAIDHDALNKRFSRIALLLQGGGALGAYQAGVYEALADAGIAPNCVTGVSIGAINGAIIAGNPPQDRIARLRQFWEGVTALPWAMPMEWEQAFAQGDALRTMFSQYNSTLTAAAGVPGFFKPRVPPPWLEPPGKLEATSYYDTTPLRSTLEGLIDFDRINAEDELSIGAVNVRSGNFVYFTPATHRITVDHVMASGALPPGFPAVEIDGEHYWDGGLVSNTPLQFIFDTDPQESTLAFQVDLWSARGRFPRTMREVATRQKEIQYSSRTRAGVTWLKQMHTLQRAIDELLPLLPPELRQSAAAQALDEVGDPHVYNIVELIYRPRNYEGDNKDFEFSRLTMEEHWKAGMNDTRRTLRHPEIFQHPDGGDGILTFDITSDGRD